MNLTSSGYLAGCVISLFVHEAGHIVAARAIGLAIRRIGITWRGPYIVREAGPPAANAIVSAAGPLVNLIMAAMTWHAWPTVAIANLVLGLANLVPTKTSDGSRVWRGMAMLWNPETNAVPVTISSASAPRREFLPRGSRNRLDYSN